CEITHIYDREEAMEVINRSIEDYNGRFDMDKRELFKMIGTGLQPPERLQSDVIFFIKQNGPAGMNARAMENPPLFPSLSRAIRGLSRPGFSGGQGGRRKLREPRL